MSEIEDELYRLIIGDGEHPVMGREAVERVLNAGWHCGPKLPEGDVARLTAENERLASDYNVAREAHDRRTAEFAAEREARGRLEAVLRDIIDGWDWWRVDPGDRESPRDEIEAGRAAIGVSA